MARIRTIKPDFFTSEDITALSPLARLLYIALWCEADREGRMDWKPRTFKLRYLPADNCDIAALCQEIVDLGLVVLYGDGHAYIPAFGDHQHLNPREAVSTLPDPSEYARVSTRQHASGKELTGREEGKGKEGKGREDGEPVERVASAAVEFADVVSAYHAHLPNCARVATLTDKRKREIRNAEKNAKRLCRERGWEYGPDFWQDYFAECAKDEWRRGDKPNPANPSWRQNIDVLLRDDQFAKIMDAALEGGA